MTATGCHPVPKFQIAATGSYEWPLSDSMDGVITASVQHVGTRFTQPADQENNPRSFVSGLPFGGATGANATVLNLELPSYQLVNFSAGVKMDDGLLLSFDRERGGRARLGYNVGQPRTFGMTVRKEF